MSESVVMTETLFLFYQIFPSIARIFVCFIKKTSKSCKILKGTQKGAFVQDLLVILVGKKGICYNTSLRENRITVSRNQI